MSTSKPFAAKATLRLAATMALAVALLSLAAMALQYRLVESRLMQAQQTLLTADLNGLAALYDQRRIIALRQAIDTRATAATGDEMLLLMDRGGTTLAGTRKDWPATLAPAGETFTSENLTTFTEGATRWLAVARTLPGGFPLLVARSLQAVDDTLAALRRGMLALLGALLVAGALVGWLAARSVMTRINRINTLADKVAEGQLDARLPGPRTPDEFGLLETHVHAMLDRIENLNRATHRLSDTIAHELRTPLNRMLQKLSKIEGQPDLAADLKAEMRQAIRMFDSLLDISRAEADQGSGGGLVPVDLSAVAAEVWDLYDPLAEDKGLRTQAHITPNLQILGDRNLIAQVLSNLLDNAIKYCASGDHLTLQITPDQDRILMRVADTGPGLPDTLKPEAFDRFTRAERDRATPGHGLGLALVRAIAARHGARLTLPPTEKGFSLEIRWPRLQQSD
ncbi:MAG: HAMP domain-containing sensor histidine kinase [Tabrizicola sp.]|uniref:sensor histidine kinase n=1 Tax=Tabrizicola sp. TaxID=2005166 RepID=UPI002ABCD7D4|nr:HAMP domain-containing sensor histidine kinase [Tabrizicola sp.]MDZ4085536.1 HAMP domain-containing sensor histidine kinase [Tabrizicola sp.]